MSDFDAKTQNSISARDPPETPPGELTALPQTSWLYLRGPAYKGREGRGEREGRGREREGEGSGWPGPEYFGTEPPLTTWDNIST